MANEWLKYAEVFGLSEYSCSVIENLSENNDEGSVEYLFYFGPELVAKVIIIFSRIKNTSCVPFLMVNSKYQGRGIGRKIAYGLRDFAVQTGLIDTTVITTATQSDQGSEPFATSIGPEIDLNDLNSNYMQWRAEYEKENNNTGE